MAIENIKLRNLADISIDGENIKLRNLADISIDKAHSIVISSMEKM